MNEWINLPSEKEIEDNLGFVYIIECTINNKYYIGKKQFHKQIRRKPLKGKRRVRISHVQSPWRQYFGSSQDLLSDKDKMGENAFKRRILKLCKSKYDLAMEELLEQLRRDVLNDPLSYNGIINIRLKKRKMK